MSTIRVLYEKEPDFPATDQHPDAVRYKVGKWTVDAIGGEPTPGEVLAVLNPPPRIRTPREKVEAALGITVAELKAELARP